MDSRHHSPKTDDLDLQHRRSVLSGQRCSWRTTKISGSGICTSILVLMTATIAFYSSIYTAAIPSITEEYGCSSTVATLGITTFLLGFGSGPLLFAPLYEVWGRNTIFHIGSDNLDNRSVPLALFSAACLPWACHRADNRRIYLPIYLLEVGILLVLILSGVYYVAMVIFLEETYPPRLLLDKRRRIPGYSSADRPSVAELLKTSLTRPWLVLFTEPILLLLSLYMAFIYETIYLDFTVYPVVYREMRGWSAGIAGLSFLGICFGMAIATLLSPYLNHIQRISIRQSGAPYPETRLPHLIVISYWTAAPPIHWISGIVAGVPFGFGLIFVFLGITSYLTDFYGPFGASALAASAVLRSIFGAVFPLFATDLCQSLGVPWATNVLAFISLAMAPLPWMFYEFGLRIRAHSNSHQREGEMHRP
ncbi:major facilitator superfamily domain-containing protein [Aspergillus varians]